MMVFILWQSNVNNNLDITTTFKPTLITSKDNHILFKYPRQSEFFCVCVN